MAALLSALGTAIAWVAANPDKIAAFVKLILSGLSAAHADPNTKAAGNEVIAHFPGTASAPNSV